MKDPFLVARTLEMRGAAFKQGFFVDVTPCHGAFAGNERDWKTLATAFLCFRGT
jgi:hypothetical protein